MIRLGATSFLVAILAFGSAARSQAIVDLGGDRGVAIPTAKGGVLFWRPGDPAPYQIAGLRSATGALRRPIAELANLPDGRLLVVERFGRVVAVAANKTLTIKTPLLGRFNVKGDPSEEWEKNVVSTDQVAAAAVAQDGRLYLAADGTPSIVAIAPAEFLAEPRPTIASAPVHDRPRLPCRDDYASSSARL